MATKLLTPAAVVRYYGEPVTKNIGYMDLALISPKLRRAIPALPSMIYCNHYLHGPLLRALTAVAKQGLGKEIKTWDGCFNIRRQRRNPKVWSLHSWGLAIDINEDSNQMGQKPTLSPELVKCFEDNGFHWGGRWRVPDGMHFQLAKLS